MTQRDKGGGMSEEVKCERCEKVFQEIFNSVRAAVENMRDIAAKGKGEEHAREHDPDYNRYLGLAIGMHTLLKEFFPERIPEHVKTAEKESTETSAPAAVN